ncbi:hypothetical protein CY34DRAFT_810610 [Suillus luteus UH-Slu-Lm8-n1]|uniref:Uncharacterized protein n=1 Tax=Suillus luteus UH-Slu-Lm8-n1 TaxID=930992 RepID=A0A0D0AZ72_9AGAM|nr:hypothetical protein CY34DRAFT_810610 [Suillus luteus UH-Slu-Lm8-n1]
MKGGKQLPGSHQKPVKTFEGHKDNIVCIATFPDGKRTATAFSRQDNTRMEA